jgi:DNA invertase Pin-like site-specific DNA recombinase
MSAKILATHLERRAVVYLRQSTLKQVHENRESTSRQYALRDRALALGWPAERVEVVDEDLGQSGARVEGRMGFKRLAENIVRGLVGALLALEVSRLARSSADWHQLLEICRLADVVIVDEHSIYNPRDYNDKLLLGVKGTLSEAELNWMRLRLEGGRLNKVRRGEFFFLPPAGYDWDPSTSTFRMSADEEVAKAIQLIFDRFRLDGSAYAVFRYLHRHGIRLPSRGPSERELHWVSPRYCYVLSILHNPIYAGAYAYGRHQSRVNLVDGKIRRQVSAQPQESWTACLRGHHPGYIEWEEYVANQSKLRDNRTDIDTEDRRGAAREGGALLQGLALCGRCGHRMTVHYQGSNVQYLCRPIDRGPRSVCWMVPGKGIDAAVAHLFLDAVKPPEIELGLAVLNQVEQQTRAVEQQWRLRLERAEYEAKLAERRYKGVDPDNRVVARTLEGEWNEKLREIEELELERKEVKIREKLDLSEEDRARILTLSRDLSRVWNAKTTTNAERKNLLRMLVREVTLSPISVPDDRTQVRILWQTGAVTELDVPRPGMLARTTSPKAVAIIRSLLREGKDDAEIAASLNKQGMLTGQQRCWTPEAVSRARYRSGSMHRDSRKARRSLDQRTDGLFSPNGLAVRFGVRRDIISYWTRKGIIVPAEGGGGPGRRYWFRLDEKTAAAIEAAKTNLYKNLSPYQRRILLSQEVHYA